MSDASRPNVPVPDELAAVREHIRALETRETELKTLILANPDVRTGNRFLAEVREIESRRTDLKSLREMYPAIAEEHTFPVTTTRVELRGITDDGEIISARKMRAAQSGDTQ